MHGQTLSDFEILKYDLEFFLGQSKFTCGSSGYYVGVRRSGVHVSCII